jgi:hypothetical protein
MVFALGTSGGQKNLKELTYNVHMYELPAVKTSCP